MQQFRENRKLFLRAPIDLFPTDGPARVVWGFWVEYLEQSAGVLDKRGALPKTDICDGFDYWERAPSESCFPKEFRCHQLLVAVFSQGSIFEGVHLRRPVLQMVSKLREDPEKLVAAVFHERRVVAEEDAYLFSTNTIRIGIVASCVPQGCP